MEILGTGGTDVTAQPCGEYLSTYGVDAGLWHLFQLPVVLTLLGRAGLLRLMTYAAAAVMLFLRLQRRPY